MNPIVFVTLDTLIKTSKNQDRFYESGWSFNNTILELVRQYKANGYRAVILGNKFGVGDGLIPAQAFYRQLDAILKGLDEVFVKANNKIATTTVAYCAERDTYNTLPNPGLIYQMAIKYEGDLTRSILIGSSIFDLEAQRVSGIGKYIDTNKVVEL